MGIDRLFAVFTIHLELFLLIQRDVLRINEVSNFFNLQPRPSRHDVIQAYELGFSQLISKLGWIGVLFSLFRQCSIRKMVNRLQIRRHILFVLTVRISHSKKDPYMKLWLMQMASGVLALIYPKAIQRFGMNC